MDLSNVVYDTASDWLAVDSESTSFINIGTPYTISFGSNYLDGYLVTDHAYLVYPGLGVSDFP